MRVHGVINIDNTYPVRDVAYYKSHASALDNLKKLYPEYVTFANNDELTQKVAKEPPDPLFARIEQELIRTDLTGSWHTTSVRQIIINVNRSNTNTYDAGGAYPRQYRDRPIVFFYEGPMKLNAADVDEHGRHIRDSLPVILNLNQDFRGVLFAPNSPVVVVGHNKNFQGFVVAKSFVELDTSVYVQQPDGSYMKGGKTYYKKTDYGFDMFIDERGNVQYKKDANGNYTTVKPVNTAKNFTYYYETVDPDAENLPDYYVEGETEYITKKIDADGTLSDGELNALLNALRAQGLTDNDLEAVHDGEVTDEEYTALQTKLYLKDLIESSTYVR